MGGVFIETLCNSLKLLHYMPEIIVHQKLFLRIYQLTWKPSTGKRLLVIIILNDTDDSNCLWCVEIFHYSSLKLVILKTTY